jgi:ABC-type uncharacterized transport system permease subunit
MATTVNPSMDMTAPPKTWREFIKITRFGVFSVFFIVVGAWILLTVPNNVAGDVQTTLNFNEAGNVPVPTVGFAVGIALLYIAGGVVGLLPNAGLRRVKFWWLLLNTVLIVPVIIVIVAAGQRTNVVVLLSESMRVSTPLVLGALAGLWCERSGVTNIAIEGMMLTGACLSFVAYTLLTSGENAMSLAQAQIFAVPVGILCGGLMSAIHAWLSITYKTNQIVSGTVINILAIGLTSFIRRDVLISATASRGTINPFPIPGLTDIPVLGDVFFSGKPIFYSMFILLIITHVVMYYTRWGLRTRAVGENPHAADTLGINVVRNRWINVIIGGMIAGLAGAWFTLETTGSFDNNMTSGKGFIALAAMIFGNWTPFGAFGGGILFGFSEALGQRFQFLGVAIPPQFLQMVPYLVTIIALAGVVGKVSPPKADGVPWEKE